MSAGKNEREPNAGVVVAAGPVPGGGALVWRVRAGEPGRHMLRFRVGAGMVDKELVVGDACPRVSAERLGSHWTAQILHPIQPLLPANGPRTASEIQYAGVHSYSHAANWWILTFFIISLAAVLLRKAVFKVRF
jgi:hypothetical protein